MTTVSGASGLSASEQFTKDHAHLGARDYIFARLVFDEQRSAESLASGAATETFNVRFEDRIFTMAGKKLDVDLEAVRLPDSYMVKPEVISDSARPDDVQRYLLGLQDVGYVEGKTYDFTKMTRQEISAVGKELFFAGKITLQETFVFEHPDGKLKMGVDGRPVVLNPHDRIDFVAEVEKMLRNMEATGEANQPKSGYAMIQGLLDKLLLLA